MSAKIQVLYSVSDVAKMLGYSVQRARRYLRRRGVELPQGKGVRAVIPLVDLLQKLNTEVDSASLVQRLKKSAAAAADDDE